MGLRHIDLGINDVSEVYLPLFSKAANVKFSQMFVYFNKDITFFLFTKFFSFFSVDYNLYIFILSIPINIAIGRLIYKYSEMYWFSFILFLSLGYYLACFTLLRHSIALAFIVFSYDYLLSRKKIKFVLMVLVASFFHQTALLFLIAYPLARIKINIMHFLAVGGSLGLAVLVPDKIRNIIFMIASGNRFQSFKEAVQLSLVGWGINLVIILVALYYYKRLIAIDKENVVLYNLSIISLILMGFAGIIGEMYRLAMYFGIFNILLLPKAISCETNKSNKLILSILISIVFVGYFLFFALENYRVVPYKFFWQ
jgi:hypothetical protein